MPGVQNPCPRGAVLIEADFPSVLLTWVFLPLILSSPCSSLVVSRDSGISPLDLMVSRLKFALVLELASQSCVCVCAHVCVCGVCVQVCVCAGMHVGCVHGCACVCVHVQVTLWAESVLFLIVHRKFLKSSCSMHPRSSVPQPVLIPMPYHMPDS